MRIEEVAAQVARNCRVADAHAWGHHSLCGLLLRLRELYKWEHGLPPWGRVETPAVLAWVGEREAAWERLEEAGLEPVTVGDAVFDPFDEEGISARLLPHGWLYAAGAGPGGRPLFVLGEVRERRVLDGTAVFILGRELVRDLFPTPAMSRPGRILARADVVPWYLWGALEEAGAQREPGPAAHALLAEGLEPAAVLGAPGEYAAQLAAIAAREVEVALHHERGELAEERRPGRDWGALLRRAAGSKAELLGRALKDALADTGGHGTLRFLIENRMRGSTALFAAGDRALRRRVLPEARQIWHVVLHGGDWEAAERTRAAAHRRLEGFLEPLFGIFADDPPQEVVRTRADELEERLLA